MTTDFIINVSADKSGVSAKGFGTILVLGDDVDSELLLIKDTKDVDIDKDSGTMKLLNTLFAQSPRPQEILFYGKKDGDVVEMLDVVLKETDDFFFITTSSVTQAEILRLATKVEGLEKMLFVTLNEIEAIKPLSEAGLENTMCLYHESAMEFPTEALAVIMSHRVGGKSARYQTLNLVKPSSVSELQLKELHKLNSGTYKTIKGNRQTTEGKVLSGEWTDIVLGKYWVKFNVEQAINNLAVNVDKIPFTNEGIGMLAGTVGTVLAGAVDQGILNDYRIDYVKAEEVSAEDKAERVYKFLDAMGELEGAIHGGPININLIYDEVNA